MVAGVSEEASLLDHPLIHEASAVYGSQALRSFEAAWMRGGRATQNETDPIAALRERERDEARLEVERLRRENAELEQRVDHERGLRQAAERREREARKRSGDAAPVAAAEVKLDLELSFHHDVLEAWYEHLTPSDRTAHPLGRLPRWRSVYRVSRAVADGAEAPHSLGLRDDRGWQSA